MIGETESMNKAQRMIEECKKERLDFGGPKTEKTKGENKGSVRL